MGIFRIMQRKDSVDPTQGAYPESAKAPLVPTAGTATSTAVTSTIPTLPQAVPNANLGGSGLTGSNPVAKPANDYVAQQENSWDSTVNRVVSDEVDAEYLRRDATTARAAGDTVKADALDAQASVLEARVARGERMLKHYEANIARGRSETRDELQARLSPEGFAKLDSLGAIPKADGSPSRETAVASLVAEPEPAVSVSHASVSDRYDPDYVAAQNVKLGEIRANLEDARFDLEYDREHDGADSPTAKASETRVTRLESSERACESAIKRGYALRDDELPEALRMMRATMSRTQGSE